MADVGRVGDHVGTVDVVDCLVFGERCQVPVVQNLIAELGLRVNSGGQDGPGSPRAVAAPPRSEGHSWRHGAVTSWSLST